jgi:hypothetical protein
MKGRGGWSAGSVFGLKLGSFLHFLQNCRQAIDSTFFAGGYSMSFKLAVWLWAEDRWDLQVVALYGQKGRSPL